MRLQNSVCQPANRLNMGFAATCPGLCDATASARHSPPKTPMRRQRAATSTCRADGTRPAENDSRRIAPSLVRPTGILKVAAPFSIRGGCDTEMVSSSCALRRLLARSDIALVVNHNMPSMSPPPTFGATRPTSVSKAKRQPPNSVAASTPVNTLWPRADRTRRSPWTPAGSSLP